MKESKDIPGHMTNKEGYISYSPRPVATKLNKIVALNQAKFYIKQVKSQKVLVPILRT